jgi:hypothetical protein
MGLGALIGSLLGGPFFAAVNFYLEIEHFPDYFACAVGGPAESLPSFCGAGTSPDASGVMGLIGELIWLILAAIGIMFVQVLLARAIANAAQKKHRSWKAFFWISFLLWPLGTLVMGIIVATLAPPSSPHTDTTTPSTN